MRSHALAHLEALDCKGVGLKINLDDILYVHLQKMAFAA